MQISKTLIKRQLETTKYIIEQYNEESQKFPQIAHHNNKQVLKMEGKIEVYESLLRDF